MLRCKASYAEICAIDEVRLVGNSLAAWPAALKNCRRVPHPVRADKPFLRDKLICKQSEAHVGNVQNNLAVGPYKGKLVALFRASDVVLDCGQGTVIDFPSWKALREMLSSSAPVLSLTANALLRLAGGAEEEVAAGLADEVKVEPRPLTAAAPTAEQSANKKPRLAKVEAKPQDGLEAELGEYPASIRLVSSVSSEHYTRLVEECATAQLVAYDVQWSPDFDEGTDNTVALVQLAFPATGNTYVVQVPLLPDGIPQGVRKLFESSAVTVVGFAANSTDVHKLQVSGVRVRAASLVDVQAWCEAEMGENDSVMQGWRVGLKRAALCVLDFDMEKTNTVASSNWERQELTTAQVEYAAMDVWVALRLFQRLAPIYRPS